MKLGIVGLPNVGKSTLFNAITNAGAESANYPFCTIEPNIGVVAVPDERLDWLNELYHAEKYTPAVIEFVDIAGLVKGASKGEGLGNKFLGHIREVDAIVHVVRCFENENIIHVDGSVNPLRDVETINLELIFSDMEIMERRIDRTKKLLHGDKKMAGELELLERVYAVLSEGKPARVLQYSDDETKIMNEIALLSMKPVIYAANIGEDEVSGEYLNNAGYQALTAYAAEEGAEIVPICAGVEAEIAQLDDEERQLFLADMGITESGLDKLIRAGYRLLGLISFLTAGVQEVRAWTIRKGTKAPQAAGKIHSDFERGFIRAEIVSYNDLHDCGNIATAKERGLYRSEGKDYVMQDGDVVLFRFNV